MFPSGVFLLRRALCYWPVLHGACCTTLTRSRACQIACSRHWWEVQRRGCGSTRTKLWRRGQRPPYSATRFEHVLRIQVARPRHAHGGATPSRPKHSSKRASMRYNRRMDTSSGYARNTLSNSGETTCRNRLRQRTTTVIDGSLVGCDLYCHVSSRPENIEEVDMAS